jgi:hypothetical protein
LHALSKQKIERNNLTLDMQGRRRWMMKGTVTGQQSEVTTTHLSPARSPVTTNQIKSTNHD